MGKLRDPKTGEELSYTRIPNSLIRSKRLSAFDKVVYNCIASCNPSFPSYEKLMEWTGLSRERVWKSLRHLSDWNLIVGYKRGRSTEYFIRYVELPDHGTRRIFSSKKDSSKCESIEAGTVRQTNSTSSGNELQTVRQTNSKKNKEKEQRKRDVTVSLEEEDGAEEKPASRRWTMAELIQKARDRCPNEVH